MKKILLVREKAGALQKTKLRRFKTREQALRKFEEIKRRGRGPLKGHHALGGKNKTADRKKARVMFGVGFTRDRGFFRKQKKKKSEKKKKPLSKDDPGNQNNKKIWGNGMTRWGAGPVLRARRETQLTERKNKGIEKKEVLPGKRTTKHPGAFGKLRGCLSKE